MNDFDAMHRCLELAKQGRGKVGINPMVGAVLVRDGSIIAEGFHSAFGGNHAERALLSAYQGEISPEDVLYVNLEPCFTQGKTPPCTNIIIDKGIQNVVYGMKDPNPDVSGNGIEVLDSFGVNMRGPVLPELCERLNRGYVSLQNNKRPWATLKMAYTRARKISEADGSPMKITSEEQDVWSHENLRAKHDAFLVGVQTVINDDPQLTVRLNKKSEQKSHQALQEALKQPLRILLDPQLRVPINAKIVNGDLAQGTIIVTTDASTDVSRELIERGVKIIEVPLHGDSFDLDLLFEKLMTPEGDYHGITSILVEGGAKTWEEFKNAGVVDEEVVLVEG